MYEQEGGFYAPMYDMIAVASNTPHWYSNPVPRPSKKTTNVREFYVVLSDL